MLMPFIEKKVWDDACLDARLGFPFDPMPEAGPLLAGAIV